MYVRCNAPWPDGRPTTLCALHTFRPTPCSRSADLGCASCCSRRARRFLQNLPMTRMGRKKAQRLYSVGIKELYVTPKGFRLE